MENFITFMFWWMVIAVFVRSIYLLLDHPRPAKYSLGADSLRLILGIALLAWVSFLKYGVV